MKVICKNALFDNDQLRSRIMRISANHSSKNCKINLINTFGRSLNCNLWYSISLVQRTLEASFKLSTYQVLHIIC